MFNKLRYSYSTKLIIIFTLLNLICIFLPSTFFYIVLRGVMFDNYSVVAKDISMQISQEIDRKADEILRIANLFVFDQNFHRTMRKQYDALERQDVLNSYLLPKGNTSLVLSELKISVRLYLTNTTIPEYYYIRGEGYEHPHRATFEVMHIGKISDNDYYKELKNQSDYVMFTQVDTDKQDGNISLIAKLINFSTMEDSGVLRIVISLETLFGNSIPENFGQELNFTILDSDQNEIFNNDNTYLSKNTDFTVSQDLDLLNYKMNFRMPQKNISRGISVAYSNVFIVAIVCFLFTFIISLLFKKWIYKSISQILHGIDEFMQGNYEYNITTPSNDEFSQIATSLNSFAHSTNHLINDVYEVMIQKQDVEFQMLQAKINPHFMYNIFSIISQLAKAGKNENIIRIVDETAKFYRSAFSANTENNTLENELKILREYFVITDIQRPDAVKVEYDIDPQTLDCLVPSFILQPIVENSIKHAMVDGRINIKIEITVSDDMVKIVIKDNGIGMTQQQIDEAFSFKPNRGYGLYNINERIRLRYSDPRFNISCESEYMKGTTITLTVPFITQDEEEESNV